MVLGWNFYAGTLLIFFLIFILPYLYLYLYLYFPFHGQIILEMVDFYAGTLLILALASIEIMAMNWIYGTGTIAR